MNIEDRAFSNIEIISVKSPGPGGKIDPQTEIKDPKAGTLYVLWERRTDHSIGIVGVVVAAREPPFIGVKMLVQGGPVVDALGSLIVEHSFRLVAMEARIEALEVRLTRFDQLETDAKKQSQ